MASVSTKKASMSDILGSKRAKVGPEIKVMSTANETKYSDARLSTTFLDIKILIPCALAASSLYFLV